MPDEPKPDALRIIEEADSGHRFVVYTAKEGLRFELRFDGDEPWFTQLQLASMFGVDARTVSDHIAKLRADGELSEATNRNFRIVRTEGTRTVNRDIEHYGLDVAFYVGYRVNSREGQLFRRWATSMLVQVATKGFVIDVRRLEAPQGRPDYFDELLEKIRHIRSSEQRMWMRTLELASFCSDYDQMDEEAKGEFFATIQNAMHWATTQQTAAEVLFARTNRDAPNAGLTTFDGDLPTVAEGQVAKNYYAEAEIRALNLVTSLTLEFFESQVEQSRATTLGQFLGKLRDLLKLDGRPLIGEQHRGGVSMAQARRKASEEVKAFKERIRSERELAGEKELTRLASDLRKRGKSRPKKG